MSIQIKFTYFKGNEIQSKSVWSYPEYILQSSREKNKFSSIEIDRRKIFALYIPLNCGTSDVKWCSNSYRPWLRHCEHTHTHTCNFFLCVNLCWRRQFFVYMKIANSLNANAAKAKACVSRTCAYTIYTYILILKDLVSKEYELEEEMLQLCHRVRKQKHFSVNGRDAGV